MRNPPRPLSPGDIVVGHSEALGEWTAAQVTHLDPKQKLAAVLELAWSGPEPSALADLGELTPLRLTHHSWSGALEHTWHTWVLPKGHRVLANVPPLVEEPPLSYASMWRVGMQLDLQRQWDGGNRGEATPRLRHASLTAADLPTTPDPTLRSLSLSVPTTLDCALLPPLFPALTGLTVHGTLATLTNAAALGRLTGLRELTLYESFGMTPDDVVHPADLPNLSWLTLDGIPADYAKAMRKLWKPEEANGTHVDIRGARSPEWVAENRDNPLRTWADRVPAAAYRKAVAQYRTTRRAVLAALAEGAGAARLTELGAEFGEAVNTMDAKWEFVETVEREELFDAVRGLAAEPWAQDALAEGLDSVRDW